LERAMLQLQPDHSVIVMTAAVSDFTVNASALKMSSGSKQTLNLEPTNDVLTSLVSNKQTGQTIVGFAAQTEDVLLAAKAKIARKGCDLLVANLVSATQGFGKGPTEIHLITSSGESKSSGLIDKDQAAHLILDAITEIQDRNH
jgi:phosphopantothenoylcysteine decarboxylase / phosphopantothenate---cysteine ligase